MHVAVLFTTHFLNATIIDRFTSIDVGDKYKKWLLYDCDVDPVTLREFEMVEEQLVRIDYPKIVSSGFKPIWRKMIPGSNHFMALEFMEKHQEYSHVWVVEYDVCYTGSWNEFFSTFDARVDFLSTKIRRQPDNPNWPFWRSFKTPAGKCAPNQLLASFNPLYRLSRTGARHLRNCFLNGWVGHHEVTMATLLNDASYCIEEIGGNGGFTPSHRVNQFYSEQSFRWRPAISLHQNATLPNTLYHPVKLGRKWFFGESSGKQSH